jgi:hypothetical protein
MRGKKGFGFGVVMTVWVCVEKNLRGKKMVG